MKHLLSGVAIVAMLGFASPVWAQQHSRATPGAASAAAGASVPMPAQPYNPATPGAQGTGAPMPAPENSATPPEHHAVRHARAMHAFHHHMARKAALSGDTTAQLNRQELARIQQGNAGMPAPQPAMPGK